MSSPSHHVEEDSADECPESWAKAAPLACAHQRNRKISTGGGDVMNGLLETGKEDLCDHLWEAKVLEHQDCDTVRNSVAAAKHNLWQRPKSGMFGN